MKILVTLTTLILILVLKLEAQKNISISFTSTGIMCTTNKDCANSTTGPFCCFSSQTQAGLTGKVFTCTASSMFNKDTCLADGKSYCSACGSDEACCELKVNILNLSMTTNVCYTKNGITPEYYTGFSPIAGSTVKCTESQATFIKVFVV
jgi:hypothetical protein